MIWEIDAQRLPPSGSRNAPWSKAGRVWWTRTSQKAQDIEDIWTIMKGLTLSPKKDEYTVNDSGLPKLVHHRVPCALCARYRELCEQRLIQKPSILEMYKMYADMETYIHHGGFRYSAPIWFSSGRSLPKKKLWDFSLARYKNVECSMQHDFLNDHNSLSLIPPVGNRDNYVISFSLYVDKMEAFPYYWLGLKFNIDAVKRWFHGWTIHLHVEASLIERRPFFDKMVAYALNCGVALKVVTCRKGAHPMVERYRPLMDLNSGICMVRDIDSTLSLTDAKIVGSFMKDPGRDVLRYLEHKMHGDYAMGGGVTVKLDKKIPCKDIETVFGRTRGRNLDECRLKSWLDRATNLKRHAVVQVRMTDSGTYCLDYYRGTPKVLWGCTKAHRYEGRFETMEDCLIASEMLVELAPSNLFVYSHRQKNRATLLQGDCWCR